MAIILTCCHLHYPEAMNKVPQIVGIIPPKASHSLTTVIFLSSLHWLIPYLSIFNSISVYFHTVIQFCLTESLVRTTGCIPLQLKHDKRIINWKEYGSKRPWSRCGIILASGWRNRLKRRNPSIVMPVSGRRFEPGTSRIRIAVLTTSTRTFGCNLNPKGLSLAEVIK